MKNFSLIIISGRRWFQKTYGNTYHTVAVEVRHDDASPVHLSAPMEYGYGEQYLQTAYALLVEAGYMPNDGSYSNMLREHREKVIYHVADVSRQKDL